MPLQTAVRAKTSRAERIMLLMLLLLLHTEEEEQEEEQEEEEEEEEEDGVTTNAFRDTTSDPKQTIQLLVKNCFMKFPKVTSRWHDSLSRRPLSASPRRDPRGDRECPRTVAALGCVPGLSTALRPLPDAFLTANLVSPGRTDSFTFTYEQTGHDGAGQAEGVATSGRER
ncbi:unnamed protein product [Menidia menidia]|uniref:(Atlantic silverside) hypothetical protein n=1 Tax=Menidia menidia TaxID=238744 RepID=A0A8S4A6S2_9TELE|nr:unnamed protein product [Menidia menidia]